MEATKLEVKLTYVLIFVIVKLIGRINQRTWILYDWLHSGIFVGIYLKMKKKKKEAGSLSLSNLSLVHQLCSPGHIMFLSIFVERHQVILPSPPLNLEIENWEVVNCILTWYIYQWTHLLMLGSSWRRAFLSILLSCLPLSGMASETGHFTGHLSKNDWKEWNRHACIACCFNIF